MKKYKNLIIILVLVAIVAIYCYCLINGNKNHKKKINDSKLQEITSVNLDSDYPTTPRDLVEYYSKILVYLYSGKATDDNVDKLSEISRKLFDTELIEKQSEADYTDALGSELQQYKEEKRKISSYIVEKNGEIEYKTFQGHYYAFVDTAYYMKGEKSTYRTLETYTLRKDDEGKWKILYWSLTPLEEDGETTTESETTATAQ